MKSVSYVPYCIASLLLLIGLSPVHGAELFPHGPNIDSEFEDVDDDDYMVIALSRPFPFAGMLKDNITLDENGNFNFQEDYNYDNGFPIDLDDVDIHDVIAVLWNDLDPLDSGRLFYRETMNSSLLMDVGLYVKQILGCDFRPTWAFIATWTDYHHYEYEYKLDLEFQAVLATDGTTSYALFLYSRMDVIVNKAAATIGVHKASGQHSQICHGAYGILNKKQSQRQSQAGMVAFRTDLIEQTKCIDPFPATKVVCPAGTKKFTMSGCVERGHLGGYCNRGRCLGENVRCKHRTNTCVYRGRCDAKMICHNRY